jgi:hypothetical protein
MGYEFMHVGVPTTKIRPHERYVEEMKIYIVDPEHSDFNIEYVRFMDGTSFPEVMHFNPHVAYKVDSIAKASEGAQVIVDPIDIGELFISFIIKDNVIYELMEFK